MALEMQRGRSPYWYARLFIDGVRVCRALNVVVEGTPPKRLSQLGDVLFERSRARAQAEHDKLSETARKDRREEQWLEQMYEMKTGNPVPSISLSEMSTLWEEKDSKKRSAAYISQARSMHNQFVAFLKEHYAKVTKMAQVVETMAKKFMAEIEAVGFASNTFNNKLDILRSTFNALATDAGVSKNPFANIEEQPSDTISRRPFSRQELEDVLAVAKRPEHSFIYPALVTASMTSIRRADCCLLQKTSINREDGTINVRTSKTGKPVTIPIAPMLAELLDQQPESDLTFVFPDLAREFMGNPDSITDRTRAVLKDAGFFNQVPGGPKPIGSIQIERGKGRGIRCASIRDFHSFRATWVTIALNSGVPIAMVCKVTGHNREETLLENYFSPSQEDFRRVLSAKLPQVLGGAPKKASSLAETLDRVAGNLTLMTEENWPKLRDEIVAMIAAARSTPAADTPIP